MQLIQEKVCRTVCAYAAGQSSLWHCSQIETRHAMEGFICSINSFIVKEVSDIPSEASELTNKPNFTLIYKADFKHPACAFYAA